VREARLVLDQSREHLFPKRCTCVPYEAKSGQPFDAVSGQATALCKCPLVMHPIGKLHVLRQFIWYIAVPDAGLVLDEASKHFLPDGRVCVPHEPEGGQPLDPVSGRTAVPMPLVVNPSGELGIVRPLARYIAVAEAGLVLFKAREHLLP